MPRGPRRDAPNEIHHVWVRGLERRQIFIDDGDRWDLVDRLSAVLPESDASCLAWAFLPNHFHLVVKRRRVPLSRLMARINSGYATTFNRRHERVGFLFQNRFGSRVVTRDAELIAVVRYVVRNPLKHGVCADEEELAGYPWGSTSGLTGRRPALPFEALEETRCIVEGAPSLPNAPDRSEPDPAAEMDPEEAFESWIQRIAVRLAIDPLEIDSPQRTRELSDARAALCWIGVAHLGLPGARVAARLGVSKSGVSRSLARGRGVARNVGVSPRETQQLNQRPPWPTRCRSGRAGGGRSRG